MFTALVVAQVSGQETVCGPADRNSALCEWLLERTNNEFVARASDVILVRPAKVLLIVAAALVVAAVARRAIRRVVRGMQGEPVQRRLSSLRERAPTASPPTPSLRSAQRADSVGALLRSTISVFIWGIAAVMILGQLGLAVGPLLAGAGVVGVAIGFGSQNLVRDLISGVFMLIEDQYGVGDVIDTGPASGVVEGITLRTTQIRDVQGTLWHVPNGRIERVGNMSQLWSRALLDVEVAYATDLGQARRVIKDVADTVWRDVNWADKILEEPEIWGVEVLGSDGISIRLVVKTVPLAQWEVSRELRERIKVAFDDHGIEIPFPQRVIWHRNEPGEPAVERPRDERPLRPPSSSARNT